MHNAETVHVFQNLTANEIKVVWTKVTSIGGADN